MKEPKIGDKFVIDTIVTDNMLASSVGSGGLRVLATPTVLTLFEKAAYLLAEDYMTPESTTVGTAIQLNHIAATPVGSKLKIEVSLTAVDGRKYSFEIKAYDEKELVATGSHQRVSVWKEKFQTKADAKLTSNMDGAKCKYKVILFDLDGTLSESGEGVKQGILTTMEKLNKPLPDLSDNSIYIGPPLLHTFSNICGLTAEEAKEATKMYMSFYSEKGKYCNRLYDGMEEVLKALKATGAKLVVTTSKYEGFAEEIMEYLKASQYFDLICGSSKDGSRKEKNDVIMYAMDKLNCSINKQEVVLIGDSKFDTIGAGKVGCDFIGVTYGYGKKDQMEQEGCTKFADTPKDILQYLI